jgi:hypothetical protein
VTDLPSQSTPGPDHAAPTEGLIVKLLTNYAEPARIRAIVTAVVALCGALGVVLPFDLPGIAEAAIVVLSVLLPLIQGESTRSAVVSPKTHAEELGKVAAGLSNGPA